MPYIFNTIVGKGKSKPLTTWQTPAAALCQAAPKVRNVYAGVFMLLAGVNICLHYLFIRCSLPQLAKSTVERIVKKIVERTVERIATYSCLGVG